MCRGCQTAYSDVEYISYMELMRRCWFWQVLRALPAETGWRFTAGLKFLDIFMRLGPRLVWYKKMARRTCFREQYYTGTRGIMMEGKIAGQDPRQLYVIMGWFFINISGYLYSFGLASCVVQENISLLQWIAAGSSRKSIRERLGGIKVSCMMRNFDFSWFGDVWRGQMYLPGPRGSRASVLRDGRCFFCMMTCCRYCNCSSM